MGELEAQEPSGGNLDLVGGIREASGRHLWEASGGHLGSGRHLGLRRACGKNLGSSSDASSTSSASCVPSAYMTPSISSTHLTLPSILGVPREHPPGSHGSIFVSSCFR